MKKVIFLVLFLNSFLFSSGTYNPAKDYLDHYYSESVMVYYPISYAGTVWYFTTDDFGVEIYKGFLISSSYYVVNADQIRGYPEWYKIIKDYSGCPDGQEIIDGVCATPPVCDGTWDSDTDTCMPLPPDDLDDDNDGIPNKCDPDYVDYLTMDCDGDGTNNDTDTDIDGDGILNANDPNPYVSGSSDTPCPASSYTFISSIPEGMCSLDNSLFQAPDYSIKYITNVYWDSCRQQCGLKYVYCPENQTIVNGQCRRPEPNEDDCIGTKDCYIGSNSGPSGTNCTRRCHCLTVQFPTRVGENLYFEVGVSCSDNYSNEDTVKDLREKSDVNTTLPQDLLKDSNATYDLDVSASMKVALDSYAGAKEETQKELLTESKIQTLQLVNSNTNLKTLNNTLENFSAVSTSNDGAINSTLKGVKDGIDTGNGLLGQLVAGQNTGNGLLEDIKGLIGDLNISGDGDSNVTIGGTSFGDEYTDSDDESSAKGSISGTLDSVYAGLEAFATDNTNMINKIQEGFTSQNASMSSGTAPIFCATVFNRQICINLCDSFGTFSGVLYYIFYVVFMFVALKLYYSAFRLRG